MDKNKAIKTISRWIDIRLNAGYEIVGIGFKGMGEIRIRFKKKEDNIIKPIPRRSRYVHSMDLLCIDEMHEVPIFLNKNFNIKDDEEKE